MRANRLALLYRGLHIDAVPGEAFEVCFVRLWTFYWLFFITVASFVENFTVRERMNVIFYC